MSFTAQYYGQCAAEDCDSGRISPGQQVEYVDGELVHVACARAERKEPLGILCNRCNIYHRGQCW